MAMLGNKRKLAAVARETHKEYSRIGQSRNASIPRINQQHITQYAREIEGKFTEKLSQEFVRTESHILRALSKLDEFVLKPHTRTHSGTVPGIFWNTNVETRNQMRIAPRMILILKWTFRLSVPSFNWLRPRRSSSHGDSSSRRESLPSSLGDRTSRRNSVLLRHNIVRKTKEGALYKSAWISQWKHPCHNWSRPDTVTPWTIGNEQ